MMRTRLEFARVRLKDCKIDDGKLVFARWMTEAPALRSFALPKGLGEAQGAGSS